MTRSGKILTKKRRVCVQDNLPHLQITSSCLRRITSKGICQTWCSCPRRVSVNNRNTPRRRIVITFDIHRTEMRRELLFALSPKLKQTTLVQTNASITVHKWLAIIIVHSYLSVQSTNTSRSFQNILQYCPQMWLNTVYIGQSIQPQHI